MASPVWSLWEEAGPWPNQFGPCGRCGSCGWCGWRQLRDLTVCSGGSTPGVCVFPLDVLLITLMAALMIRDITLRRMADTFITAPC